MSVIEFLRKLAATSPASSAAPAPEAHAAPDFARAFRDGGRFDEAAMSTHVIGRLHVPTGRIVACDPLVCPETEPLAREVPRGDHDVVLSVARHANGDERIAFAMLRWSDAPPTSWEPALLPGDDPSQLAPGEAFGYGVDAGLGCFMDAAAAHALLARMEALGPEANYYDDVLANELAAHSHTTWDWCEHRPDPARRENVFVFSSGFGDGIYSSYFGVAGGAPVCLVTDFGVVG